MSGDSAVAMSVVIATHNRESLLSSLLDDLAAQQCDLPFEVIVVDDGSEPPVSDRLLEKPLPYPLRSCRRPTGGPAVARHDGIERACGDLIVLVDDDMGLPPDFLDNHNAAHQNGADVVLGRIDEPGNGMALPLFERFHQRGLNRFRSALATGRSSVDGTRLCTGNVSFRRHAYVDVGGFDLRLKRCEDRDLGIRFERMGLALHYSDSARSVHHSDHRDVSFWRRRNALYGESDTIIADKYCDLADVSPWAFLDLVSPLARPLLLCAASIPRTSGPLGACAYGIARALEYAGWNEAALTMTGLCYGIDYFGGVRRAHAGAHDVYRSFRSYQELRRSHAHASGPARKSHVVH
jgi:GT2 family glycosyltransferase